MSGTTTLISVNPNNKCTAIKIAGAMAAITALIPYISTAKPNGGLNIAEIMYGIDIMTAACDSPSVRRSQYSVAQPVLEDQ